jgi:hypothetical protein
VGDSANNDSGGVSVVESGCLAFGALFVALDKLLGERNKGTTKMAIAINLNHP